MKTYVITCPELPERRDRVIAHFEKHKNLNASFITGIHAPTFGLMTCHPYDYDNKSDGFMIPQKHVGLWLSHYICWSIIANGYDDDVFMICEDDVEFEGDVNNKINQAIVDAGHFDVLFVGSYNTSDKESRHICGDVYEVKYPHATHAYILTRDCAKSLLMSQRDVFAPIDLSLILRSFPDLKVYTILPTLAKQCITPQTANVINQRKKE